MGGTHPTPSEAQGEILYYCWRVTFHNATEKNCCSKFTLINQGSQTAAFKLLSRKQRGAFKLLYKHLNQNEHISKVQFHQPRMVLPVKLRYPVRKITCVSRQTCLNKSGKRHSKPSMGAGTTIKTAAAPPVWVMPTLSLNASALRPEIVSLMCLVLSEPSRLLSSLIACASFFLPATLALQSRASHYMHVNNCALDAQRVFEAVWQVLSS